MELSEQAVTNVSTMALREDIGAGAVTARLIAADTQAQARGEQGERRGGDRGHHGRA